MGTRERDVPRRRTLYDVLEGRTDQERDLGRESPAVRRTDIPSVPDRYVWNRPDDPPPPRTPDRQLTMDESLRTGQRLERSVWSDLMSTGPARQQKKAKYQERQARIKEDRKTKQARIQRNRAVADSALNLARSYGGGVVGSGPGEAAAAAGEAERQDDKIIAGPLLDTAIGGFGKGVGHMISLAGRSSGSEAIQRYGEEVKYTSEVAQSPDQMLGMDELKEFGDYVKFAIQQTSSGAGSMGPVIGGAAVGATIGSIAGLGGAALGGIIGGLAAGFPLIYGETVDALEAEGITGPAADVAGVLGGLAGSALELLVPLKFARRLAPGTDVAIKRALGQAIKHIARVGGVDALQEGTTELLQTQIPAFAGLVLTEGEVNKFTTKEHWIETGIATGIGMLLGGTMGTVGGAVEVGAENLQAEAMDNLTGLLNDTRLEDDQLTPEQVNSGYPFLAQYAEFRQKRDQPDMTIEEINRFYDTLATVQGDADAGGLAQDAVEEAAEADEAEVVPVEAEVAPAPSETAEMDVLPDQELGRTFDTGETEGVEPVERGEPATQDLKDLAEKAKEATKASRAAKAEAKAEKAQATDKAREEAERLGVTIEQVREYHAERLGDDWKEHRLGYYEVRWAADRIKKEARPQEVKDAEERAYQRSRTQTAGAMKLIDEHGLTDEEVATIKPSSQDGKHITHNDVKGYLKTRTAAPSQPALDVEPAAEPAAVEDYEIRPLTTKSGKEFYEVFAPDGKRIAKTSTEQAAREQIDIHRGQPAVSKPEVAKPEKAASRAGMPAEPATTSYEEKLAARAKLPLTAGAQTLAAEHNLSGEDIAPYVDPDNKKITKSDVKLAVQRIGEKAKKEKFEAANPYPGEIPAGFTVKPYNSMAGINWSIQGPGHVYENTVQLEDVPATLLVLQAEIRELSPELADPSWKGGTAAPTKQKAATTAAGDLATAEGIDLNTVEGSGKGGVITVPDVKQAIKAAAPTALVGETSGPVNEAIIEEHGFGRMWVAKNREIKSEKGEPWGLDNGAFGAWRAGDPYDFARFEANIETALEKAEAGNAPILVVLPDRPAEGQASLTESVAWLDDYEEAIGESDPYAYMYGVRHGMLPFYLAVQDGVTPADIEASINVETDVKLTDRIAGIFLGGTDKFKTETAEEWAAFAKKHGLKFHYARAGTPGKVKHAKKVGATSLDSALPLMSPQHLERFVKALYGDEEAAAQLALDLGATPAPELASTETVVPEAAVKREAAPEAVGERPYLDIPDAQIGGHTVVVMPETNEEHEVVYALIPIDELVASHTTAFAVDPAYPEDVQNRAYDTDKAAQQEVTKQANALNPQRLLDQTTSPLEGPPIVNAAGEALSGNQRLLMLKIAAEGKKGLQAYHDQLLQMQSVYGFEDVRFPEHIEGHVLVRVLTADEFTNNRTAMREMAVGANVTSTKRLSPWDDAATRMDAFAAKGQAAMQILTEGIAADQTIINFLETTDGWRFFEALIKAGVFKSTEMATYADSDESTLTQQGRDVIEKLVFAAAIGDVNIARALDADGVRQVANKVKAAAPAILKAATIEEFDRRPTIRDALDILIRINENPNITNIMDLFGQGGLWAADQTVLEGFPPDAKRVAVWLQTTTQNVVKSKLRDFGLVSESQGAGGTQQELGATLMTVAEIDKLFEELTSIDDMGPEVFREAGLPYTGVGALARSRATDMLGRLKTFYHGTRTVFSTFDLRFARVENLYGPAFYVTDTPNVASGGYSGNELGAYQIGRGMWTVQPEQRQLYQLVNSHPLVQLYKQKSAKAKNLKTGSAEYYVWNKLTEVRELEIPWHELFSVVNIVDPAGNTDMRQDLTDAAVKLGYMTLNGAPNVHYVKLAVKNPFEIDRVWTREEVLELYDKIYALSEATAISGEKIELTEAFHTNLHVALMAELMETGPYRPMMGSHPGGMEIGADEAYGDAVYQTIRRVAGDLRFGERSEFYPDENQWQPAARLNPLLVVNGILDTIGYDAVEHDGGVRSGLQSHQVYAVFRPESILPAWYEAAPEVDTEATRVYSSESGWETVGEIESAYGSTEAQEEATKALLGTAGRFATAVFADGTEINALEAVGIPSFKTRLQWIKRGFFGRPKGAYVDVGGQVLTTPEDFIRFLQPFRDPRFELLGGIITDSQGRVVWVEYYSSGSVRMVVLDKLHRRITRKLHKLYLLNPDETYTYHLSHNHPSGDPSPSIQDVDATNVVSQYVTQHGPPNASFGSHWVIDHDSVSEMVDQQVLTHPVPTDIQTQPDWTDAIGPKLTSKLVYDTMRPAAGRAVAIITDQQHQVIAVEPHSNESVKKIANWMDQTIRRYGGNGIVLVTSDEETYKHIINNSEVVGGLTDGHESIAPEVIPNMVSGGLLDVLYIAESIPDIFSPGDLGNYFKGANAAGLLTFRADWYGNRPGEKADYTVRVHEQQNPYGEDMLQAALGNPNDFRSPDVRERWDESKGLPHDPLAVRVKKALTRMKESFTRHFPHLNPKIATHAAVADKLRIWEASPEYAVKMAADAVAYVVEDLSPEQMDLVTRIVALPDILKDIENELYDGRAEKVPFYGVLADGSPDELEMIVREIEFDLARFEQLAAQDPGVTQALNRRSEVTTRLARALVQAELLNEDVLVDPRYYHRQVIAAFSDKGHNSLGKVMDEVRTKRRGFQKARHGGGDFNTRYVEAEFEWMQQGFHQLATKEVVEAVRDIADVRPQIERLAAAANEAAMVTEMEDADWDEGFRVAIARSNGKLAKMALTGELYGGPFQHIVDQLAQAKEEYDAIIAGMDRGEKGAFRKANPFRFNHEQWFPFLAWLVNSGGPGAAQAGSIFKTIHERKAMMRETLGTRFRTWRHFMPEGYTVWQPREGNLLYPAVTIGERHLEAALERLSQAGGLSAAEAVALKDELQSRTQTQLVLGGRLPEWVIPEEIAQTLNSIRNVEHGYLGRMHLRLLRAWKIWTLLNPTRWLKYNVNNQTGDIDGILAWNAGPLAPKRVKGAWKGLRAWGKGTADKKTKAHYDKMLKLGVIGSNFAAQEIPDINDFQSVRHLLADDPTLFKKVVDKYWNGFSKGATNFRENLLRVTAYEFILEQMMAGKNVYGASNRHVVDAIKDVEERAARVARDLVGDYGNRTEAGQWIRERMMPFWSWAEINFGRYIRLFQNAGYDDLTAKGSVAKAGTRRAATAAAMTTAAMLVRINLLYLMIFSWNQLMAKRLFDVSEEEYDRFFRQRRQLHLIVGRHSDGSLATIRTEGAWSDWLEWWNLHDWIQDVQDVVRSDKTVLDVVAEAVKGPVERVANSLEPFGKTALEAAFQRSTFPSVFEEGTSFRPSPRVIRDPIEHFAQMWSFERLYRRVTGRPHPPGGVLSVVGSILLYRTDPGEAMYWESRGMAFDWLEDQGREMGSYTPTRRQNALYYYRKAIVWGDEKAQARWLDKYHELGGTERGMNQSLRMQHPLGMIAKRDQDTFLDSLTDQERDAVERAEEWYELVYGVHRTDVNKTGTTPATPRTGNKPRRSATTP